MSTPTPGTPVGDLIVDDVVAALGTITTIGGYPVDAVIAEDTVEGTPREPGRFVVIDGDEDNTAEGEESGHDEYTLTLTVSCAVFRPDTDDAPAARTLRRQTYGAIRTALLGGPAENLRYRNGLAQDTQVTGYQRNQRDDGISVAVRIRYLTILGDYNSPQ